MANIKKPKSKSDLPRQYKEYSKYKWEFLRRNPEYRKEWEELSNLLDLRDSENDDWRSPDWSLAPEEINFCKNWRIAVPLSPDTSYDNFTLPYVNKVPEGMDSRKINIHGFMFEILFPESFIEKPIKTIHGWARDENNEPINLAWYHVFKNGKLKVEIDFNYSKKRLKEEFDIVLDKFKDFYHVQHKKFKSAAGKTYGQKNRFDDFDIFLKVYDLRRDNLSWKTISENLGLNNIQTARNHYNSACKLIRRGIDLYNKKTLIKTKSIK